MDFHPEPMELINIKGLTDEHQPFLGATQSCTDQEGSTKSLRLISILTEYQLGIVHLL